MTTPNLDVQMRLRGPTGASFEFADSNRIATPRITSMRPSVRVRTVELDTISGVATLQVLGSSVPRIQLYGDIQFESDDPYFWSNMLRVAVGGLELALRHLAKELDALTDPRHEHITRWLVEDEFTYGNKSTNPGKAR